MSIYSSILLRVTGHEGIENYNIERGVNFMRHIICTTTTEQTFIELAELLAGRGFFVTKFYGIKRKEDGYVLRVLYNQDWPVEVQYDNGEDATKKSPRDFNMLVAQSEIEQAMDIDAFMAATEEQGQEYEYYQ